LIVSDILDHILRDYLAGVLNLLN